MKNDNISLGYGMNITAKDIEDNFEPGYYENKDLFKESKISKGVMYQDLGDGRGMINIVKHFPMYGKEPALFGKYAAVAALNEIYATGYTPISASIIAGWPKNKYTEADCSAIIKSASEICDECNVTISGGYYTESAELIFGLSVTGIIDAKKIESEMNVRPGCSIYITKPLGVEMVLSAALRGEISVEDFMPTYDIMIKPEKIGAVLSRYHYVKGVSNLSCFGLLGHLVNAGRALNFSAEIDFNSIPILEHVDFCLNNASSNKSISQNWEYFKQFTNCKNARESVILSDPVPCGGLIIGVDDEYAQEFKNLCDEYDTKAYKIGEVRETAADNIIVKMAEN
ncbi:MAG: selenide, water dikinase SelD [Marinifilaceae bacterium]|jgi:selenide,water dikinase|nr:selenide, water dikinase SelD [Marinifilaceae bacterium]